MSSYLRALLTLTVSSMKMYFRDFTAVFFSFIFPVIFLLVFGFISSNDNDLQLDVVVFNQSETELSTQFEDALNDVEVFVEPSGEDAVKDIADAKEQLEGSDINAAVVIGEQFGNLEAEAADAQEVQVLLNEGDQNFNGIIIDIVSSVADGFNEQIIAQQTGQSPAEPIITVDSQSVQSDDLGGIDYLLPGIIAFSILSLGLFSIAQGFISMKSSGALRRLQVAPINPLTFIVAQSITRLIVAVANVFTMYLLAVWLFDFNLRGNIILFHAVAALGALMFLGMGFAIAGWAKDENQSAPVANIIFFPMMFLSGTFFPRELFPDWLQPLADVLPLTYLADALRDIANYAVGASAIVPELIGMGVWTVLVYGIAAKLFRWE